MYMRTHDRFGKKKFHGMAVAVFIVCGCLLAGMLSCTASQEAEYDEEMDSLKEQAMNLLGSHVDEFNGYEGRPSPDGSFDASNNREFLQENVPLFISSNDTVTKVYNYRWWMISKHLKEYDDPVDHATYWVVTEFFGVKPWASLSGAITCPAGHQFYDVRWLRDPKFLYSYAEYYMKGSASRLNQRENGNFLTWLSRPESHHFSSWMIDGVDALLKIHPDRQWLAGMLPYMEGHQQVWDSLFTVHRPGSRTDGMYKILDLYDGMEFSLSAVLGLIESGGSYALYTRESWKDYYLGWGTTGNAAASEQARRYPKAFRGGYPDYYLVRPSVNGYAYGNMCALSRLYELAGDAPENREKASEYAGKAEAIRDKTLDVLWNEEDHFFHTVTAGDNAFGAGDYMSRVRESVGYTPWYFGMIPPGDGRRYEKAWEWFGSPEGFYNDAGMTTAERAHPYYNEQAYAWNGRGWPFQNSVVYKAYANYLRDYKEKVTPGDRDLLYDHIMKLVRLHGYDRPNIGEWYIPSDGEAFGGEQDYFHSTFPDILIEDLLGFRADHEDRFALEPLLPADEWDYFYLGNIRYHHHDIDIVWKKDWDDRKAGDQGMLRVWVDGRLAAESEDLNGKLTVPVGY